MKALFVELPAFARLRQGYLDDEAYRGLQNELLKAPGAGDAITGTGGLRKIRHGDTQRGKGKRGGLRVIDKDELDDLSPKERSLLKDMLKKELEARG